MSLIKELEIAGFSPKEALVYIELVRLNTVTPAQVAKVTKITRPTAYNILRSLVNKGVASENLASTRTEFSVLPPESLLLHFTQKRKELDERESKVKDIVDQVKLLEKNVEPLVPKIRFIEERDVLEYLHTSLDRLQKNVLAKDAVWYGFQDKHFVEQYGDWIEYAGKKFEKDRYQVKLFTNVSDAEKKLLHIGAREVKFIDKAIFTSTVWIVGDYIVMISAEKKPFYVVEIYDAVMASNFREFFRASWEKFSS